MLRKQIGVLLIFLFLGFGCFEVQAQDTLSLKMEKNEYWWGGVSSDSHLMPYSSSTSLKRDLLGNNYGNQAQPLLLSSHGRYIWSSKPIAYHFDKGSIKVTSEYGEIKAGKQDNNLREAFQFSKEQFFPPQGEYPNALMFTAPQYNTWIELMYDQNQEDILEYARNIIDQGYPPGVIMIDDNWQKDYGVWKFSSERFSNPKKMMDELHKMGFKVMLWVVPLVSPDSRVYRDLAEKDMLLNNSHEEPAMIRWWNGVSAALDLSNPDTQSWFKGQLDYLVKEYGVDGFKFDGGDTHHYQGNLKSHKPSLPNDHTRYFAEIGLDYPLNEYRASWKMAGYPLAQRLRDKDHSWEDLQKLIPGIVAQGLMGYAFTCPDMIGGGQFTAFLDESTMDEELIVRSAQVHALMPMMQFSVAPWRILSQKNQRRVKQMAKLHSKMGDTILELAKESAQTGEPIVRPMAYTYPNSGYATIKDQFMLGPEIMVAPVVQKGQRKRTVKIPEGTWKAENGNIYDGPTTENIDVPIGRLPWFKKITP
ncbi:glycoside hydrolase family 31 protein [Fodinibius sp. SL11]|uniref:glycoside hydrolase family 31 protein n=1 Tax=Fodinibius sp. SL11 TaxID=3425690 RepID=UPI003F8856D2